MDISGKVKKLFEVYQKIVETLMERKSTTSTTTKPPRTERRRHCRRRPESFLMAGLIGFICFICFISGFLGHKVRPAAQSNPQAPQKYGMLLFRCCCCCGGGGFVVVCRGEARESNTRVRSTYTKFISMYVITFDRLKERARKRDPTYIYIFVIVGFFFCRRTGLGRS